MSTLTSVVAMRGCSFSFRRMKLHCCCGGCYFCDKISFQDLLLVINHPLQRPNARVTRGWVAKIAKIGLLLGRRRSQEAWPWALIVSSLLQMHQFWSVSSTTCMPCLQAPSFRFPNFRICHHFAHFFVRRVFQRFQIHRLRLHFYSHIFILFLEEHTDLFTASSVTIRQILWVGGRILLSSSVFPSLGLTRRPLYIVYDNW